MSWRQAFEVGDAVVSAFATTFAVFFPAVLIKEVAGGNMEVLLDIPLVAGWAWLVCKYWECEFLAGEQSP